MNLMPKILDDPKHFAWVSWSLMSNNPVTKNFYLLFCLLDLLLIMYYSFNLTQRVHFSNFNFDQAQNGTLGQNTTTNAELFKLQENVYEQNDQYMSGGIQLTFLRRLDYQLNSLIRENFEYLLYGTIVILAVTLLVILALLGMAVSIKNHSGLEKGALYKQVLCIYLVCMQTFLSMPVFDVVIRTLVSSMTASNVTSNFQITSYLICSFTLLTLSALMLYIARVFNICVPTEHIPWCAPISKIAFLNLVIKLGLVVCNSFDLAGDYSLIESLIFFLLQGFQASYRVLFAPNYIKEIDLFTKTKDFTVALIFFIGIICKCLGDQSNYDFVYFLIFIPFVTLGWILFEEYRKQIILQKVKNKSLKMEVENEFALYLLMTLVRDCQEENVTSQKVFGQLMDLIMVHIEDCDDQLCICDEMENYYELLRLKQLHNMEVFPLMRAERKKYKKIIDDQGLIGTVSNITDLTLKQNTTESTLMKSNHDQDRQLEGENRRALEGENNQDAAESAPRGPQKKSQNARSSKKKSSSKTVYKINIDETRHRFLSELLYLYYFEMIQRFPESFKIQLLSNYFALLYKKKEMLCVFQMRSFNKMKLSKLDQCCHTINEQYLLWEINKIQKVNMHQSQNQQEGNFNGDYFIRMNQLYKEFNLSIESLSASVAYFWKSFEASTIDATITYNRGTQIATNIINVFKVFNELDALKITKDYQMYFQFAIVQLHILNDPVAYELYIGKMKSILEINKVFQKNFSNGSSQNSDQSNFIIVDANGAKFGQIIQCNNSFRMLLGWSEEEVKRFRIENFMPTLIRDKHPEFMGRYNKTGQSYIINSKVTMFIKKSNGYVIPVELYIKFHFSIDYQYTFLAIVKPFYEMTPFANGVKYNINQLIFLIVENDADGRISEFSESCFKMLSGYGFKPTLEINGITKTISDVIIDFDFTAIRRSRQDRYMTNQIYESVHKVDLNQFNDSNSMTYEYNMKRGQLLASILQNNGGIVTAKTRLFEERYSGGILDMNIFCFAFINENDGNGSIIRGGSSVSSKVGSRSPHIKNGTIDNKTAIKEQEAEDHAEERLGEDGEGKISQSGGSSYSASSGGTSTTSMAEFRNFHSFSEQVTPKTLMLIIRLIIALYVIMVTIAGVNVGINIQRQMESEKDVHTVRQSFDRMNWVSMNQLLVRVLLNIANGYEPEDSILIDNRFSKYVSLQEKRIQQLKDTQSSLQQNSFDKSDEFTDLLNAKNVPLYYLSDQNTPYIQYETLNVAFNLYIAKLTEVNSYKKSDLVGNLSIQTLNSQTQSTYRPTYHEQSLFFVVQNGNKELRQFSIKANEYYSRESENHAEQNITQTKVTAIVSIVVIVVVSLIIAPILTQAEIRKFKALLYFLKIPKERLRDLIKNSEYCLNMNEESRYLQIMHDYESFLGVKLVGQQVEQLRQARVEKSNIEVQDSKDGGTSGFRSSDGAASTGVYDRNSTAQSRVASKGGASANQTPDDDSTQEIKKDPTTASQYIKASPMKSLESYEVSRKGKKPDRLIAKKEQSNYNITGSMAESHAQGSALASEENIQNADELLDHQNEANADQDMDQKEEVENTNKLNLNNLNLKRNRVHEKKLTQQEKKDIQAAKSQTQLDGEAQQVSEMDQKIRMINAQAYKRRSTMIFSSLSIILLLSSYFIIAYFLAMKTFQTAAEVIISLESIFYKGSCFDSAMNFLRESQIRNESMKIKDVDGIKTGLNQNQEFIATEYYLDFCFKKEDDYNKMRVSMPSFFQEANDYILKMESSNMCSEIYTGDYEYLQPICKTALNGILNKGLTNAFYHMFTQILKANLNFLDLGDTALRSEAQLRGELLDTTMVQIIDMKAQILDRALNELKIICMSSVIQYIQKLLNDFITAFIVFLIILTLSAVCLIFIGFKVLRKSMWDTNIILKIIPFETLPKKDRIDIKDFFNS